MQKTNTPFLAIQHHLYEYPLYRCCPKGVPLNVLIIGFDEHAQNFLDVCLQNGQLLYSDNAVSIVQPLNITVIPNDKSEEESYLNQRIELCKFFNINGSLPNTDGCYGDVSFEYSTAEGDHQCDVQAFMGKIKNFNKINYIFISLGDDSLNGEFANACQIANPSCAISYVCESTEACAELPSLDTQNPKVCPVYVNTDVTQLKSFAEIERMAFNVHLIWEKNFNVRFASVYSEFKKDYNYNSCIGNVISLKYKLYGIGINLETVGFVEAASAFEKNFSKDEKIKSRLVWMEHRRWVAEKLCLGWKSITDLEECATGVTKDEKKKRHVCIVRSMVSPELSITEKDHWNLTDEAKLKKFDDLDRMSISLHQVYVAKAKEVKKQNILDGNIIAEIKSLIEGNKRALVAFCEWFACLKDIWNGDKERARLYKSLKNAFLNACEKFPRDRKAAVSNQVAAFEALFYPIIGSIEYRDWKKDDVALIDNIPFILTYTPNSYIIVPYTTGNNTELFSNVAASTVIGPERILYLYDVKNNESLKNLTDSVPYVVEYMRKKNFKAAVEFILICSGTADALVTENYTKQLIALGEKRIRQVKVFKIKKNGPDLQELTDYLIRRSKGKKMFIAEKNETYLSGMLEVAKFYNIFPSYSFESRTMEFSNDSSCDMLKYINKKPYLTVADMFAFKRSTSESSNHPEFYSDYVELWNEYKKHTDAWKKLCDILAGYTKDADTLVYFLKLLNPGSESVYTYILPFSCITSVTKILNALKKQGIVGEASSVSAYTTDSCKVVIFDKHNRNNLYNKLFSNIYALMLPDYISVFVDNKGTVNVIFDELKVSKIFLGSDKDKNYSYDPDTIKAIKEILTFFKDRGYIINLCYDKNNNDTVSFSYSTRSIKELLTTAGKILEVYTYHAVKAAGYFDDVVSSYEINWEGMDIANEFDCILTKGFRTLFVECKARSEITQDFYFKLKGLTRQFGINATAVLLADTEENPNITSSATNNNAMQRQRGEMMDVITIWRPGEITKIEEILSKIIDGEYENTANNK